MGVYASVNTKAINILEDLLFLQCPPPFFFSFSLFVISLCFNEKLVIYVVALLPYRKRRSTITIRMENENEGEKRRKKRVVKL